MTWWRRHPKGWDGPWTAEDVARGHRLPRWWRGLWCLVRGHVSYMTLDICQRCGQTVEDRFERRTWLARVKQWGGWLRDTARRVGRIRDRV